MDDSEVINFLLSTEIIPLCLRIMEAGSELSKTVRQVSRGATREAYCLADRVLTTIVVLQVATFIVQKILLDDVGLSYICATYERFYAVSTVLSTMVASLIEQPSQRLLKHIIRCYLRLCDNPRAREALRPCLPEPLRDGTFAQTLKDDPTTKRWLGQLLVQLLME